MAENYSLLEMSNRLGLSGNATLALINRGQLPAIYQPSFFIPEVSYQAWLEFAQRCQTTGLGLVRFSYPTNKALISQARADFEKETGRSLSGFIAAWQDNQLELSKEKASLVIEAHGLLQSLTR